MAPPPAPLSGGALDLFSAVQLATAGTTGALCAVSSAFVIAVAVHARRVPAVAPFTQLAGPRLVLHACACASLGAQLLRLPSWWAVPSAWTPGTPREVQAVLCRLAVCVPYGWALPLLSTLAVAMVALPPREPSLPDHADVVPRRRRRSNPRTVLLAAAAAVPVAAAQTLLAFHDPIFGADGGLRHSFGPRWLDAVIEAPACTPPGSGAMPTPEPPPRPCSSPPPLSCVPPLLSSALSGIVAVLFGIAALWHCRALASAAVSVRLGSRARMLGHLLLVAPLASAALRCMATLSAPQHLVFELLLAIELAAVIALVGGTVLALSVMPSVGTAAAASAVGWAQPGAGDAAGGNTHALLRPLLSPGTSLGPGSTGSDQTGLPAPLLPQYT